MDCYTKKCLCSSLCGIVNKCVILHPLLEGHREQSTIQIRQHEGKRREKFVIDLLQHFQPPKVSRAQIDRYYMLYKKHGIDLDKDVISIKQRRFHEKFKRIDTNKRRRAILINPDTGNSIKPIHNRTFRQNTRAKKRRKSLVGSYLQRHAEDVTLSVNNNYSDRAAFFELADKQQKQRDIIKSWHEEPEPNFHYE